MSLTFQVQPRGKPLKKLPKEITISSSSVKSSEIYSQIAKATGLSVHRLRITKGSDGSHVAPSSSVESTGLRNRSSIAVKDLGPQIPWRTVFVIEYLGPLLIHPIFYYLRPYIYSNPNLLSSFPEPSPVQTLALWLVSIHFIKREFETLFVHRFSLATMPAFNIFKNSAHYWLLAGFNIAYWIYSPHSPTATLKPDSQIVTIGIGYFIIGELGNLYTHVVLRNLRKSGTTTRAIPQGLAFDLVTCPNYMFEILAWVGISLVTWSWSTVLFTIVAGGQMILWGIKKESRYRKEFGDKYKRKSAAVLPGII
jgi:very-long-chain enoyl-CoA reductase